MSDLVLGRAGEASVEEIPGAPVRVHLSRTSIMGWVWWGSAIVYGLGLFQYIIVRGIDVGPWKTYLRIFDLNEELCLPAWYSSLLIALAALLLVAHGYLLRERDPWASRRWLALGAIFLFLSLDEAAVIHEQFMHLKDIPALAGFFRGALAFSWVVVYLPLVVVFAIVFLPFTLRLPAAIRWRFIVSAIVFVGGALGMEMFAGWAGGRFGDYGEPLIEEGMEIFGISMFVSSLLYSMQHYFPSVSVDLARD